MFTKLDRVARSAIEGSKSINSLLVKNIRVHILNIGIMDNTPASKLIRQIFLLLLNLKGILLWSVLKRGKPLLN